MAGNGATLAPIYERLNSVPEYHPFNADTFSDWSMEAGDMVTVSRDGKSYTSPVHSSEMTWKGQSQISVKSDGSEERESISNATKKKYGRGGSGYRNDNHLWQELLDDYNGLYSFFEVTSSRMYTHFEGLYDGLSSTFEITRSRMYVDFQGMYDGLSSTLEVTRSRLYVHFTGLYDGLSSTLEVTRSRLYTHFTGLYDGLSSTLEVTRSRLYANLENTYTNLQSSIDAQAGRIDLVVEGTGANSHIKPAVIQASINAATGQSKILLSADNVVVDGTLVTSKITADYISAKIADIPTLHVISLSASGNINASGAVMGSGVYVGSGTSYQNLSNAISDIQIVGPTDNVYTLQYKKFNSDGWQNAAVPFSRATTLSGGWSSGKFTVHASPQGNSYWTDLVQGETSWDGNNATVLIQAIDSTSGGNQYNTGRSILVDASGRYTAGYNSGYSNGSPVSGSVGSIRTGTTWTFTIQKGDGNTTSLAIDCASIYASARNGYTLGIFTAADITLQGGAQTVFVEASSGGTDYYTAGAAATYYNSGSGYTHYDGNGGSFTQQGTKGPKLFHYGKKQLYYYDSGYKTIGSGSTDWYYVSNSNTSVQYYNAGTVTKYDRGNTVSGTNRGTKVTVTPIGTRKHLLQTTRYAAGTRYNKNRYYTKS